MSSSLAMPRPPKKKPARPPRSSFFPYMRSEDDPEADHHFDSFLQPDDLSGPDYVQLFWRADDIVERFAELQVKAIVTPDGRWHASEAEVWDDEA